MQHAARQVPFPRVIVAMIATVKLRARRIFRAACDGGKMLHAHILFTSLLLGGATCFAEAHQNPKDFGPWSSIQRWQIEVQSEHLLVRGKMPPRRAVAGRILAATFEDEFYYFVWHQGDSRWSDWRNEPFNFEITLRNERLTKCNRFNRAVEISRLTQSEELPRLITQDVLFLFLPIWPLNYPAPRKDERIFPVKTALESGKYAITTNKRLIAEIQCSEFRSPNGIDRIWLADDRPLCVMRRDWFDPKSGQMKGQLNTRQVAEVADGCWLPIEIECIAAFPTSDTSGSRTAMSRTLTRVVDWRFNDDVSEDLFCGKLEPGTIEVAGSHEFRQISTGGTEHLDNVANFYRNVSGLEQRSSDGPENIGSAGPIWASLGMFAIGCSLGLGLMLCRLCVRV